MSFFHFSGAPCLQHCNYVFYKSFRYKVGEECRILSLGDFFFLKILQDIPVCIGEIELLWEDKASNQLLSSLRLYFQPEHTQDGRQEDTGEDEVLILGERLVVRLDDLLPLMIEDIKWTYGHSAYGGASNCKDQIKEENGSKATTVKEEECVKLEKEDKDEEPQAHTGSANVAIMSYPRYCRYRAIMRRLEGCENEWLHLAVVMAIGGFSGRAPGCRVMFCRETFYHPDIDDLDIRMDHMLPVLKNRPKGKKTKPLGRKDSQQDSDSMEELFANIAPSISTSSRPRRSTEPSELNEDKVSAEEQAFLIGLHKFMHDAKMPIGRIPYLGFKQIDLYLFYKHAEKLGGYDSITTKRMWKQLYDRMGGNISNTSAATCTRKHYERLLLPYERHLRKLKAAKARKKGLIAEQKESVLRKESKNGTCQKETSINERKSEKEEEEVVEEKEEKEEEEVEKKNVLIKEIKEERKQTEEVAPRTPQNVEVKKELCRSSGGTELHSMADWKNGTGPLEVPSIHHLQSSSKDQINATELKDQEIQPFPSPFSALGITEQQLKAAGLTGTMLPTEFGAAEGTVIPNTNLMYRGGYLVPIHQPQMLPSPWGMIVPPPNSQAPEQPLAEDTKDATPNPSLHPLPAHSGKTNQGLGAASISSMDAIMLQNSAALLTGAKLPVAHSNAPYRPSPYLMTERIHPPTSSSLSSSLSSSSSSGAHNLNQRNSHQMNTNHTFTNSSQSIISLLHPKPANLKSLHIVLPPAPSHLYLHPSNSNVLSPLPPPNNATPPAAHSQSRKRLYPFENPSLGGTFPSPDMVLDRIKSSTVLPNSTPNRPLSQRQQYDSPRDIFKQTAQTFASSQNSSSVPPRKMAHQSDKRLPGKSKTPVRKNSHVPPVSPYGVVPGLELQVPANGASGFSKSGDQMKLASSSGSNGFMPQDQTGLGKSVLPNLVTSSENPIVSGKDGRLTSALFGTQFTAMPRPTKQAESPLIPLSSSESSSSSASAAAAAAAAAAMPLGPLLHPAFMNTLLPPGVPASALNPQLQMFAGAYGTNPAQLAAYEELLRQNGYSFLSPGTLPAKVGKKN